VDNRVDPGANVVEWRAYSNVGKVKLIAPNATDLPLSDVQAEQNYGPVHTIAGACRYTLDEINSAVFKGNPLEQQKMNAVRESYEQEIDRLAALGDTDFKLQGLLTITGAQTITLPSGGGGGATQAWSTKTSDEIIKDLVDSVLTVKSATGGVENVTNIILPSIQYGLIATTRFSNSSDLTILEYFNRNMRGITIEEWDRTKAAGASGKDRMVLYRKSPDRLVLNIPKELQAIEPQQELLNTVIPHHGRYGGVLVFRPKSIAYADGI
jgi:hypothetical protein